MNEYDIIKLYEQMERELVRSMTRNLKRHQKEEEKVGFKFSQWQAEKLRSLQKYRKENKHIIEAYTKGLNKEVAEMLSTEMKKGKLEAFKGYEQAVKDGYKAKVDVPAKFFKTNSRKANTFIKVINNDLNKANHAALRRSNDIYREVIHKASTFVGNGVYTEKKAVDMAIKEFKEKGINCIVYKNGARHTISDYAGMAVRTANQRATLMGEGEFRKKIGETLVIVSKHGTACKICQQFESKVFIDDVYSGGTAEDGKYPLLSQAMKEGMFHPNCRHGLNTYYEGITEVEPQEVKAIKEEVVQQKQFVPATTKQEAIERMKNALGAKVVDLGRMKTELANEYLDGVETFMNEYPQLKNYVWYVDTNAGKNLGVFDSGNVLFKYSDGTEKTKLGRYGTVSFRSPADLEKLKRRIERSIKINYQYQNHTFKSTAAHELTHALEHLMHMKISGYPSVADGKLPQMLTVSGNKLYTNTIAKEIIEQARMEVFGATTGAKVWEGVEFLGTYAMSNKAEELAQAISYELTVGTNPYSAKIKEIFDKKVKELF